MDLWPGRSELQEVAARVFITNFFGARSRPKLTEAGITHVLVCAAELPFVFEESFRYKRLHLADNTTAMLPVAEARAFIRDALAESPSNRVLVHCAAGSSRSGAICVAWIMSVHNLSAAEALAQVQKIRPIIMPNPGFLEQLERLKEEKEA